MINWIIRIFRGKSVKSPYERGYEYAMEELFNKGIGERSRLLAEASGGYKTDFDRGIVSAVRDFSGLQKEIMRNILK